jgi:hypothetical protein
LIPALRSSTFSYEYTPFARDPLKGLYTAVAEPQPRAGYQILHGARYQNLACTGKRRNAGPYVDRDTADVVADHLTLASMKPRADFNAERPDLLCNGAGATNTARWTIKGGEKSVAGRFDLTAAKACEIATDRGVMMIQEITSALVAECGSLLGGADDIGEEDRRQDTIDGDRSP